MAFGSFVNSPELYHAFGFVQMPTVVGLMLFFQTVWAPVDSMLNFVLTLHRWCSTLSPAPRNRFPP